MPKLNAKQLAAYEAKRDLVADIERSVKQMKSGVAARVHHIKLSEIVEARNRTGLSQPQFAKALGVSLGTLRDWEQGRRKPTGAARSLLTIAKRRPDVLRELFAD